MFTAGHGHFFSSAPTYLKIWNTLLVHDGLQTQIEDEAATLHAMIFGVDMRILLIVKVKILGLI